MHTMVSVLVTPNHTCFKCKKPWFTDCAAKRMYVHEEFCFVENPPPHMEVCAFCDFKSGKYWLPEDEETKWYFCSCKDCGEESGHCQMTAFCERCLLSTKVSHCPKCGKDLKSLIEVTFNAQDTDEDYYCTDDTDEDYFSYSD